MQNNALNQAKKSLRNKQNSMDPCFISQSTTDLLTSLLPQSHRRSCMGEWSSMRVVPTRSLQLCQTCSMSSLLIVAKKTRLFPSIVSRPRARSSCVENDQFQELLSRYRHMNSCRRNLRKRLVHSLLRTWPSKDDDAEYLLIDMGETH